MRRGGDRQGGRLVAPGTVDELRAQGVAGRLARRGGGSANGWVSRLPGVRVLSEDRRGVLVALEGTDDQALLDAARAAGRGAPASRPDEPTLAELFRKVIA